MQLQSEGGALSGGMDRGAGAGGSKGFDHGVVTRAFSARPGTETKPGAGDVAGAGAEDVPGARERAGSALHVERLEFSSIDDTTVRAGVEADAEVHWRDEVAALELQLQEQKQAAAKQVEEARLLARLLARKEWEDELDKRLQEGRVQVRRACEEFDRERTRYFAAVEGQVVKLALAIAGRVLHREAKMDPLLLSAAVRVALEKVKDDSDTRIRVPRAEVEAWRAAFGIGPAGLAMGGLAAGVEVVGDPAMVRGECVIETSVGTVELGIEAQMLEIEQGFFDLLKKRPA